MSKKYTIAVLLVFALIMFGLFWFYYSNFLRCDEVRQQYLTDPDIASRKYGFDSYKEWEEGTMKLNNKARLVC